MTTYEQERTEQQKEIDAIILERVQRGLAWLEKKHGPGWEDKIDLETLDLEDVHSCVIGQVYGNYAHISRLTDEDPEDLGFDLACDEWDDENDRYAPVLQETWKQVLTPRVKPGQ
jgi:hypothetical protein